MSVGCASGFIDDMKFIWEVSLKLLDKTNGMKMNGMILNNVWADEGWEDPVIEERFDPDRTVLSLSFKKSGDRKAAIKSGDKKVTKKTKMQYDKILEFMEEGKEYGIWDFCELLGLKESRTKDILKGLSDRIEIIGNNRDRRYKKK